MGFTGNFRGANLGPSWGYVGGRKNVSEAMFEPVTVRSILL